MASAPTYALKNVGHYARLRGSGNDLHRELSRVGKEPPFCLCARANHALCARITRKTLHSKDAQCKTEESP